MLVDAYTTVLNRVHGKNRALPAAMIMALCAGLAPARKASADFIRVDNIDDITDPTVKTNVQNAVRFWNAELAGNPGGTDLVFTINYESRGWNNGGILASCGPSESAGGFNRWYSTAATLTINSDAPARVETLTVMKHEMAHGIGIGTWWNSNNIPGGNTRLYTNGSYRYVGPNALAAWRDEFNRPNDAFVPVEDEGGQGTANGHWNETIGNNGGWTPTGIISKISGRDFQHELMTGYTNNPEYTSNMTIQSMIDLGLTLNHPGTLTWNGGNGTWDTHGEMNWKNAADDGINDGDNGDVSPWLDGFNHFTTTAVFAGNSGQTVSIAAEGQSSANGLKFDTAGYILQSGKLELAGTTPTITANADATISSVIIGTSGFTKTGSAKLTLSGANTFTGPLAINAGRVSVASVTNGGVAGSLGQSSSASSNLVFGGGTLQYTGASATFNRGATMNAGGGTFEIVSSGAVLTTSGAIAGAGGLTKSGAGTLALTGTNTYAGTTRVDAGTLALDFSAASAPAANIISASSALVLNGGTLLITGKSGATNTQAFASTQANGGTLQLARNNATSLDVNLGALTLGAGPINFAGATGTTQGARFITSTTFGANDSHTQIAGTLWNGTGFASAQMSNGTNYLTQYIADTVTSATVYTGLTGGTTVIPDNIALDVTIQEGGAGTNTLAASPVTSIKSLLMAAGTTAATVNMNGRTLQVGGAGNIAMATAAQSLTLGASVNDGFLTADVGPAALFVTNGSAARALTINAVIANNGGTSVAVTVGDAGGKVIFAGDNTYGGATTVSSGTLQVGTGGANGTLGSGAVTTNGILAFNRNNALTVSNAIGGTGALHQVGTGTTILTGTNTYGATTITAGTLQIGNGGETGTLGSGTVTNNAALVINRSGTLTLAGAIGGTGSLTQAGSGTTILTGANAYGATTISAGTLQVGNGADTGSLGSGAVTNNAALVFNRSGTLTVVGAISGVGSLTQAGSGATILTGANTYEGVTTISTGTLQIGNGGATGSLGSGTVSNSGILAFNRNNALTVSNAISGSGSLTQAGSGTTILTGANTYGATTISAGTLQIGSGGATGSLGSGTVTNNGILAFNRNNTLTVSNAISGGGSLTQAGSGTTILTGANAYGATTISAGTLQVGNGGASGSLGSGAVTNNGILAFNRGNTLTVSNAISGGGSLTQAGSGTTVLTGTNTYGATTISAGTLQIGNGGASGTLGSGAVTNDSILTFNRSGTLTVSNAIGGVGSLTQEGPGTTVLTGINTYAGATQVDAGTLSLDFSAASAPAANIVSVSSALVMNGGTLLITGKSGATNTQTFAGTQANGGTLQLARNSATSLDVNLGALTMGAGPINFAGGTGITQGARFITSTSFGANDAHTQIAGALWNGSSFASTQMSNGTLYLTQYIASTGTATVYTGLTGGTTVIPDNIALDVTIQEGGAGTNTLAASPVTSIKSLLMAAGTTAATVNMNGRTLQIGGAGNIAMGTAAQSLTLGASVNDGFLTADAGPAALSLTNGSATRALKVNAVIADNGGTSVAVTMGDAGGKIIFAGDNTYGGATTVSSGTLQVGAGGENGTLGSGAVTTNGILAFNRSNTLTVSNAISGAGSLTQAGTGTTILTGTNTYGATTITAGTLQVGNGGETGSLGSGTVTNNAALVFNRSGTLTVAGAIGGTGSLTQAGTGTTILTGANAYGATTISAGTLQIGNGGETGSLGSGAVATNGILAFNRNNTLTVSNAISGAGSLTQAGTGTTILTGANAYGATIISAGTLQIGNGGANGALGSGAVTNHGILVFNRSNTLTVSSAIGGAGSLTQAGTGTTVLTGANTYGATTISAGTLQIGNGGETGSLGSGTVTNNAALVFNRSGRLLVANAIDGAGSLTQIGAGTTVLTGANTYTGVTRVNAGTLSLDFSAASAPAANIISASSALILNGGTLLITGKSGATHTQSFAGTLANGGTLELVQNGADSLDVNLGALTLGAGPINFIGATGISQGARFITSTSVGANDSHTQIAGTLWNGSSFASAQMSGSTLYLTQYSAPVATTAVYTGPAGGNTVIPDSLTTDVVIQEGGAGTNTLAASPVTSVNSLLMSAGTTAATVNMGGRTLRVGGVGNIAMASAAKSLTLGASVNDGFLTANAGTAALFLTNGSSAHALTVNAVIADNGRTPLAVTVGDTGGKVIFAGDNTYSGVTAINAGTLQIGTGTTHGTLGSGAVTNNGILAFNRSNALTVSNAISGTGALHQIGSGTTLLTGANTYGATTIRTGTLQVGNGGTNGTLGSGAVTNDGILAFNRNDAFAVSNAISGAGSLRQVGSGTTVLTGALAYTGTTFVDAGTLAFDQRSQTLSGHVAIASGGTLAVGNGVGTINSALLAFVSATNNGTLAIRSDGVLNLRHRALTGSGTLVNGGALWIDGAVGTTNAVTFDPGSTFFLADGNSVLTANSASITYGATIAVASAAGFTLGTEKIVLHANDAVSGSFVVDHSLSADLRQAWRWMARTEGQNVYLGVEHGLQTVDYSQKQQKDMADALSAISDDTLAFDEIIGYLARLPMAERKAAMDGLTGHDRSAMDLTARRHGMARGQNILQFAQMQLVRGGRTEIADSAMKAMRATCLADLKSGDLLPDDRYGLQVFVNAGHLSESSDRQASGAQASSASGQVFTVGLHHQILDNLNIGVAFTHEQTDISSGDGLGKSEVGTYAADLYFSQWLDTDQRWSVSGNLGIGKLDYDNSRSGILPGNLSASSSTQGMQFNLSGQVGYRMDLWKDALLTPYAGLSFVNNTVDGYAESLPGAPELAQVYEDHSASATECVLGANFAQAIQLTGGMELTPALGLAWHHQLGNTNPEVVGTHFAGASNTRFNTYLAGLADDAVEIQGSLSLQLSGGLKVFVDGRHYEALGSSKGAKQDRIGGGLSYDF